MPPRSPTHKIAPAVKAIKRRKRLGYKRYAALTTLKELGANLVLREVHERLSTHRGELASKNLGVRRPDLEGYKRSAVADNGVSDRVVELVEVLVGKREREVVLADLRKRARKGARRKIMKFVDVKVEVHTLRDRPRGTPQGGELKRGRKERA